MQNQIRLESQFFGQKSMNNKPNKQQNNQQEIANKQNNKFDIIGDLHGCYDLLLELLQKLNYEFELKNQGLSFIEHKENRKIIFVGDLLDRGEKIAQTLNLVKSLIEKRMALSVLGNHETLMIQAYLEVGKKLFDTPPSYLNEVHFTTLNAFAGMQNNFFDLLDWLINLPLALEFDDFRVAHASWRENLMQEFFAKYPTGIVDANFFTKARDKTTWESQVLETTTQGMRFKFDERVFKLETHFKRDRKFRAKFWLDSPKTYGDIFFHPFHLPTEIANLDLPNYILDGIETYEKERKKLFIGHYWLNGEPKILAQNIVCTDYSAVKGGALVAYRFSGEQTLTNNNFVFAE